MDVRTVLRTGKSRFRRSGVQVASPPLISAATDVRDVAVRPRIAVTSAELAECNCPEACDRDHGNE